VGGAYQDHRHIICIFDTQDLLAQVLQIIERRLQQNGVRRRIIRWVNTTSVNADITIHGHPDGDIVAADAENVLLVLSSRVVRCAKPQTASAALTRAVIEYVNTNPCPFFIYRSRMAVNCSVPAVSRISSMHCVPSTSTCEHIQPAQPPCHMHTHTSTSTNAHRQTGYTTYLLAVRVFNSRVIFLHEYALHKLNRLRRQ